MNNYKNLFAAALACTAASCVVETQPPPVIYTGTLALDWTIIGAKDPSACTQSNAPSIAVDLLDARGELVQSYGSMCAAFATSIVTPA